VIAKIARIRLSKYRTGGRGWVRRTGIQVTVAHEGYRLKTFRSATKDSLAFGNVFPSDAARKHSLDLVRVRDESRNW
jgi:hypothetical protein